MNLRVCKAARSNSAVNLGSKGSDANERNDDNAVKRGILFNAEESSNLINTIDPGNKTKALNEFELKTRVKKLESSVEGSLNESRDNRINESRKEEDVENGDGDGGGIDQLRIHDDNLCNSVVIIISEDNEDHKKAHNDGCGEASK